MVDFESGTELKYEWVEKNVFFLQSKNIEIHENVLFDQEVNLKKN